MSDTASPPATAGVILSISEKLIRVLPPAFLLLVIINCMFLGVTVWAFDHNSEARNALLTRIIERCLLRDSPKDLH